MDIPRVELLLVVCTALASASTSCNAAGANGADASAVGDELSADEEAIADLTPPVDFTLDDLVFADGSSVGNFARQNGISVQAAHRGNVADPNPEEELKQICARMWAEGRFLSNKAQWQIPAVAPDLPAQDGLVYSYGQVDPTSRVKPPAGTCTLPVQGLDCSGMLYDEALAANIDVPRVRAITLADANTWNAVLPSGISARTVTGDAPQPCDVIEWQVGDSGHVGLVANAPTKGGLLVIQSNGRGTGSHADCDANLNTSPPHARGPHAVALAEIDQWFPAMPNLVRFVTTADAGSTDSGSMDSGPGTGVDAGPGGDSGSGCAPVTSCGQTGAGCLDSCECCSQVCNCGSGAAICFCQ